MTIVLTRKPFTNEERALMVEAIMFGSHVEGFPELEDITIEIAEKLPDLLRRARLPDNSDNRRKIIELVLVRWAMPKTKTATSYRQFARSGRFKTKGRP